MTIAKLATTPIQSRSVARTVLTTVLRVPQGRLPPAMASYVIAAPQALAVASADFTGFGQAINTANAAGATSTTTVVAAAQDEVAAARWADLSAAPGRSTDSVLPLSHGHWPRDNRSNAVNCVDLRPKRHNRFRRTILWSSQNSLP